jgi:hypothetical protein
LPHLAETANEVSYAIRDVCRQAPYSSEQTFCFIPRNPQGLTNTYVKGPDEFRTAPLWGAGQRLFFLHDGRTSDVLEAILAHASAGSEANAVICNFQALSPSQKQEVLNFLRSL